MCLLLAPMWTAFELLKLVFIACFVIDRPLANIDEQEIMVQIWFVVAGIGLICLGFLFRCWRKNE